MRKCAKRNSIQILWNLWISASDLVSPCIRLSSSQVDSPPKSWVIARFRSQLPFPNVFPPVGAPTVCQKIKENHLLNTITLIRSHSPWSRTHLSSHCCVIVAPFGPRPPPNVVWVIGSQMCPQCIQICTQNCPVVIQPPRVHINARLASKTTEQWGFCVSVCFRGNVTVTWTLVL